MITIYRQKALRGFLFCLSTGEVLLLLANLVKFAYPQSQSSELSHPKDPVLPVA